MAPFLKILRVCVVFSATLGWPHFLWCNAATQHRAKLKIDWSVIFLNLNTFLYGNYFASTNNLSCGNCALRSCRRKIIGQNREKGPCHFCIPPRQFLPLIAGVGGFGNAMRDLANTHWGELNCKGRGQFECRAAKGINLANSDLLSQIRCCQ